MLHSYALDTVRVAEHLVGLGDRSIALHKLRSLPLADFCQLLLTLGDGAYPGLAQVLPRMPSEVHQKLWTGHAGAPLMVKTCNVARLFDITAHRAGIGGLTNKRILDYGCGWGRLLRVMYYFSDSDFIYGTDPWQKSLDVCRECGINDNLALCDAVPEGLPFAERFDFIFSFSVFTHLSEPVARAVLRACRSGVAERGLFTLTIRPEEFWDVRKPTIGADMYQQLRNNHKQNGYAFLATGFGEDKKSETYGEASIDFEYFRKMAGDEGWLVLFHDRDMMEPYQLLVTLRAL